MPNKLLTKVLELDRASGFRDDEFFSDLLEQVLRAESEELETVEAMLGYWGNPTGYRSPNQARCDGQTRLIHSKLLKRIEELKSVPSAT